VSAGSYRTKLEVLLAIGVQEPQTRLALAASILASNCRRRLLVPTDERRRYRRGVLHLSWRLKRVPRSSDPVEEGTSATLLVRHFCSSRPSAISSAKPGTSWSRSLARQGMKAGSSSWPDRVTILSLTKVQVGQSQPGPSLWPTQIPIPSLSRCGRSAFGVVP